MIGGIGEYTLLPSSYPDPDVRAELTEWIERAWFPDAPGRGFRGSNVVLPRYGPGAADELRGMGSVAGGYGLDWPIAEPPRGIGSLTRKLSNDKSSGSSVYCGLGPLG